MARQSLTDDEKSLIAHYVRLPSADGSMENNAVCALLQNVCALLLDVPFGVVPGNIYYSATLHNVPMTDQPPSTLPRSSMKRTSNTHHLSPSTEKHWSIY